MTKKPCVVCGEVSDGSRCAEHRPDQRSDLAPSTARGYDQRWRRLSERARRIQSFCSDCLSRDDLTTDHSPEAWRRREAGKPIRMVDIDVVCRSCNAKRGPARGQTTEKVSEESNAVTRGDTPPPAASRLARQQKTPLYLRTILNKGGE